ncbi:MAG: pseudouridine synthase, partial [Comamonas sp.]
MHNPHDPKVLPMRAGVSPSCIALPNQVDGSILDFLAERLPAVSRADWQARMEAGDVVDEHAQRVLPARQMVPSLRLYYYRTLENEAPVPFEAQVLFRDEHLLVADKP